MPTDPAYGWDTLVLRYPGFEPFRLKRLPRLDFGGVVGVERQHMDGTPMEHVTARPVMTPRSLAALFAECEILSAPTA